MVDPTLTHDAHFATHDRDPITDERATLGPSSAPGIAASTRRSATQ